MSRPACERCGARGRVLWACVDEPEEEGAVFFGDQVEGMALCGPCVEVTEADGPWSLVTRLDGRGMGAA